MDREKFDRTLKQIEKDGRKLLRAVLKKKEVPLYYRKKIQEELRKPACS